MLKFNVVNTIIMFIIYFKNISKVQSLKCIDKFLPILNKLPQNCQNQIYSIFRNYTEDECCETGELVLKLKECFQNEINVISFNKTIESKLVKKGLGSIKSNQFIDSIIIQNDTSSEDKSEYDSEIKYNLNLINENNKLLAKCLNKFLKINTYLLSRICDNPNSLDKHFIKKGDNYTDVIIPANLNNELYNECSSLALRTIELNDNYLNIFIKNLNYLIGIGSCNYYSDTFYFKQENDINDIFFPYAKIYNHSLHTESYEVLLNKWLISMMAENYIDKEKIVILNSKMKETEIKYPSGLSIALGRKEINYNIIINTFYLQRYNSFYVECYNMLCHAYCNQCSNLSWEKDKVMTDNNHVLFVSCSNMICLVYIENIETKVNGGEVFYIRGSSKIYEVDTLFTEKLENAKISIEKEDSKNKKMIINLIEDIKSKPERYIIDLNVGTVFNHYDIQVNSTHNISLIDYLYNHLYKGNESFSFECDNVTCNYYSNQRKIRFNLNTNNVDVTSTEWKRILRGSSSGGRSGGRSSHSSSSGTHSSTKIGGSSLTTHSTSSSSKTGGSSLTSNSKFTGFSSSKSSGSPLTKSSNSVSHVNSGYSLSKPSTYYSNTNWKPIRSWPTSSSSTSTSNYYTHSSYPIASNTKVYTSYHTSNSYYSSTSNSYHYYSYRPNYYVHYYYFPHWSHYNYHYIDNYNYYHYRAHSVYDYHNNTIYNNNENLNQLYDPNDWVISYDSPDNEYFIRTRIFNIFVECSPYFCVNYVKSNENDDIFIDVIMRNMIFLNENSLNQGEKLRLINNFLNRKNDSDDRIRYSNTTKALNIDLPYKSFPVKYSCFHELYTFFNLFNYSEALNSREINQDYFELQNKCLNGTISNDIKNKCGLNLYQSLTKDNFVPDSNKFNKLLIKKPNLDIKINEGNFDLSSYNNILSGVSFSIEIDGSTLEKESSVKEADIQLYEKLTTEIIHNGQMDDKAFSSSKIILLNIVLLHLIIYCLII